MGGSTALNGLPPLPPGATMNTPPPTSGALPPLPPGATLNAQTPPSGGDNGGLGGWAERNLSNEGGPAADEGAWAIARGLVKSASGGLGNLVDMVTQKKAPDQFKVGYRTEHKGASDEEVEQAYQNSMGGHIAKHMEDAANWLRANTETHGWETVGAIGEQMLEMIGTDGLLKMVGPVGKAAEAAQVGSKATQAAETFKNAQQAATFFEKNPKIAGLVGLGTKALQEGTTMAGQTYVHTEDPREAALAGVMGGATTMGLGGVQSWLGKIAPKTIRIGGEEMPALASQLNEAGLPMDTGARGAPAIARAQQEGAQKVIQNTAAQGAAAALGEINNTRPVFAATEDPARLLGAGAPTEPQPFAYAYDQAGRMSQGAAPTQGGGGGPQQFTFKVEGPGATEETTGQMAQSAAKVGGRRAFEQPQYTTASAPTRTPLQPIREGQPLPRSEYAQMPTAEEGQAGADIRTARTPEAAADTARGGGTLETADPAEAESWLRQLEDIQQSPEHAKLPEAQQNYIEAQRKSLQEQLGLYHASPYAQRFQPIDVANAVTHIRTFGDAAAQIEAAAKPVYNTLDQVSGGDFNKYKEAAKQAQRIMRSATSVEAYESAESRLSEANKAISDLIDRHRGSVSFQDYMTAKNAWRNASRLDELHTNFERMANGITMDESDSGLTRIMTGRAKQLENYLSKGTNREQLERLIGKEGLFNLKQVTQLLAKANTARTTQNLLSSVSHELSQHIASGGVLALGGALAGHSIAEAVGLPGYMGAIGGAMGARMVLHTVTTNPRIGQMLEFAVRNGVAEKVAAPLIARAIAVPFQQPKQQEEEGGQQ